MCLWLILLLIAVSLFIVHKVLYISWIDPYLDKLKNGPTEPYVRKNQGRD